MKCLPLCPLGSLKTFLRHFEMVSYPRSTSLMKSEGSLDPHLKIGADIALNGGSSPILLSTFFSSLVEMETMGCVADDVEGRGSVKLEEE